MGKRDPRVDAYITSSADFAKPILEHLRELVHAAVPEVEEDLKWRSPTFMYKGILCGMAAFKNHCVFGFWKSGLVMGDKADGAGPGDQFGRLTSLDDLPANKTLIAYIKKAARLNDDGINEVRKRPEAKKPVVVPDDLVAALRRNKQARTTFENFSPSHRREYVEWLTEAKTDATRQKRLATAIEWMADGKARNWKYM
jgi:uncharacterized protein YdeI (YjbR/CyaY-like superfamily)